MAAQGKAFPLAEMCDVLDVSVSGYRAWTRGGKPDRKRLSESPMRALIRAIHAELKGAYGHPAWCASGVPEASLGQQGPG